MGTEGGLTVAQLARLAGVAPDTVRYYGRIGLLPETGRSPAGYRRFDAGQAERVRFIRAAQRLGLRLAEVGELLDLKDRGLCPCGHANALVRQRLEQVEREIAALAALRDELRSLLEQRAQGAPCTTELIESGR